jgi:hypothetical protein
VGAANGVPNKKKIFWHGICSRKKIEKKSRKYLTSDDLLYILEA